MKEILRDGIMERKKSAPPYSEEHREAAREHNLIERMKKYWRVVLAVNINMEMKQNFQTLLGNM